MSGALDGWTLTTQGYTRGPWRVYHANTWCVALRTDFERIVASGFPTPEEAAALVPPEPPVLKAARLAASALTQALATERDAAAEVGTNDRRARLLLDTDRQAAAVALGQLAAFISPRHVPEVAAMADGAARGYAVPSWALRVVALATEVSRG